MECSEEGCSKIRKSRGFCQAHYVRRFRRGEFTTAKCLIDGCDGPSYTRGLCSAHYQNKRSRAKGVKPRTRMASGNWTVNPAGYVVRHTWDPDTGRRVYERQHRVVMEAQLGRPLLPHEEVHHKNGQRADNRLSNLELWSTKQPKGQRVEDKVEFALEMLALYAPDRLAEFDLAD